ncbi:hypothetical protein VaNZ11_008550 [Volvox africanus]|uniref:Uncharacterized protein n=1 Tax=Volvox africanus TaxID=51714 RepID=A0ABQ5S5G7_9CHLO|nr:hypothetical protein VaNZ11_008550 [Volvox africanus]
MPLESQCWDSNIWFCCLYLRQLAHLIKRARWFSRNFKMTAVSKLWRQLKSSWRRDQQHQQQRQPQHQGSVLIQHTATEYCNGQLTDHPIGSPASIYVPEVVQGLKTLETQLHKVEVRYSNPPLAMYLHYFPRPRLRPHVLPSLYRVYRLRPAPAPYGSDPPPSPPSWYESSPPPPPSLSPSLQPYPPSCPSYHPPSSATPYCAAARTSNI